MKVDTACKCCTNVCGKDLAEAAETLHGMLARLFDTDRLRKVADNVPFPDANQVYKTADEIDRLRAAIATHRQAPTRLTKIVRDRRR